MKKVALTILSVCMLCTSWAQELLHLYNGGNVVFEKAITDIDSIHFHNGSSIFSCSNDYRIFNTASIDSITFSSDTLAAANDIYITYNGNIGLTQNMEMLCEVARELEQEGLNDINFVLTGNGAYWDTLVAKLRGLKEEKRVKSPDGTEAITFGNITLLPFQPYEDISHVFSLGDASLVISKPGVGENSVPSKTWSIMSASRPVLANFDENELKEIVNGTSASSTTGKPCGIFTKAGDKEAFKEAILTLYNDSELCKEYGRNGRQFVMDNLTKEIGTKKYVDVIKSFEK